MNNLVKFLILGLLILCPSYLKAQEVPFAYLKCDLENKNQKAGQHTISWDAKNNSGQPVSAGMYIYTIEAGEFRQSRKMVLLK